MLGDVFGQMLEVFERLRTEVILTFPIEEKILIRKKIDLARFRVEILKIMSNNNTKT